GRHLGLPPPRRRRRHRPLPSRRPGGGGRRHRARGPQARAPADQRPRDGSAAPCRRRVRPRRSGRPRARGAGPDDPDATGPAMTSTLRAGSGELWTRDPALDDPARPGVVTDGQVVRDAAVVLEDGVIAWTGPAASAPPADDAEDLGGRAVLPGWVDSHTHLVFD